VDCEETMKLRSAQKWGKKFREGRETVLVKKSSGRMVTSFAAQKVEAVTCELEIDLTFHCSTHRRFAK
jgi:hypothetical protein